MPKKYDGKFKAECSFCRKTASLPAKGSDSFIAALIKAGFKFGVRGKELQLGCPVPDCQKELKVFMEDGIIQPILPGTEESGNED